jgi:PRC-barrel domain
MRLSELLGCEVVDQQGRSAGKVHDVRLVQDGPPIGQFGARFRVEGLITGRRALGARFGYDRTAMKGPWLLATLVGGLHRTGRYVPWSQVHSIDPAHQRITITGSADDLPSPAPIQ